MIGFLGEYAVTLDAKGRFLLPAGFKKQLTGDTANQFIVNRGAEPCLTLYPKLTWDPIFSNVSMLNDFDPKVRKFRHFFLNGATPIELDSAGRLLLPQTLLEHASLKKDILLVSAINKIEIWDVVKHKEFFDSISSSPETYSDLANEVMNKRGELKS